MPTTTEVKFSCKQCRREYRWKPELAGKQAKCKCGATISIPATPPPPPPPPPPQEEGADLDGLYALAAEEQRAAPAADQGYRCPSCGTGLPVGATMCPACGVDLSTGKKPKVRAAPGAVGAGAAPTGAAPGGRGRAALATAVATTGKVIDAANLVRIWTRRIVTGVVCLLLIALMIFRVYRKVTRPSLTRTWIEAASSQTPQEQREEIDSSAAESLKEANASEARAWVKKGGRTLFNLGPEKTGPTIEQLYGMGAKKVSVAGFVDDTDVMGTVLVVELPEAPPARKKLIDWANKTLTKLAEDGGDEHEPIPDVGQKYVEINFDNT